MPKDYDDKEDSKKGGVTATKILKDHSRASRFGTKWSKEAKEDLQFVLGEQWKPEDKRKLESQGRPCLTLNIVQSNLFLVSGYQRQTRSSIRAYPEGGEDSIKSEIATRLIKNISKKAKARHKHSLWFEDGASIGKGFIEPYVDYTYDMIHGELKLKHLDPFSVKIDPKSTEYDLSDAGYITKDLYLSKDELIEMFPGKKAIINKLKPCSPEDYETQEDVKKHEEEAGESVYDSVYDMEEDASKDQYDEDNYFVIEYQYKKWVAKFMAVDSVSEAAQLFDTKKEAQEFLIKGREAFSADQNKAESDNKGKEGLYKNQKIIDRHIPEIWFAYVCGKDKIDEYISPFYPQWRNFTIIPYFAHFMPTAKRALKREDLAYQGIVRAMKDPQREKNKRRSQFLHIINTSANSGWIAEEGSWVDPELVDEFGSTPGINLEYKKGITAIPQRITPGAIPNGHIIAEQQAEEDVKTISGINADLLALNDKGQASGRAIALRQQQGVIMIKRIFDNFSMTMEIYGNFLLSQLGNLYTLDRAKRVLGEQFLYDNGQDVPSVDQPGAMERIPLGDEQILQVLSDAETGDFDVSIGEGSESPTTRFADFLTMEEMASKGYVIPPEVLIEYSDLPEAAKQKIVAANKQPPQPQA